MGLGGGGGGGEGFDDGKSEESRVALAFTDPAAIWNEL